MKKWSIGCRRLVALVSVDHKHEVLEHGQLSGSGGSENATVFQRLYLHSDVKVFCTRGSCSLSINPRSAYNRADSFAFPYVSCRFRNEYRHCACRSNCSNREKDAQHYHHKGDERYHGFLPPYIAPKSCGHFLLLY